MQQFADWLINNYHFLSSIPRNLVYLGVMLIFCFGLLFIFVLPFAGIATWAERRIAGFMQARLGPNRVGPQGFFQWIADGVKFIFKEDIIPSAADSLLFRLAPYIVFTGMFASFVIIPFSNKLIISDLNIGIFYLLAITSIVVVGIIMAGWGSNNKWSLLGGMRSVAQIVSYEIPSALSIMSVVLLTGSLSMQSIVKAQEGGGGILNWFLFHNPFTFISFFIYFISALAEINRTPFDIPEAESELVSGYNTEYSGFRFAIFFLSEWTNIFVVGAIATTLFLGGWQVPKFLESLLPLNLVGTIVFLGKSFFLVFVIFWLRWTLPRLRVDQLMNLSWKYLTPIAFVSLAGTAIWMLLFNGKGIFKIISNLI